MSQRLIHAGTVIRATYQLLDESGENVMRVLPVETTILQPSEGEYLAAYGMILAKRDEMRGQLEEASKREEEAASKREQGEASKQLPCESPDAASKPRVEEPAAAAGKGGKA